MDVIMMRTDQVIPYARNPRVNDGAVSAVMSSIREFGFRQPIVVDEHDVIIVGHTRLKAAQKLGLPEVPVHVARGLSENQARAYRIADNKASDLSRWDEELLALEIMDLKDADIDLTSTLLDSGEIDRYLGLATSEAEGDEAFGEEAFVPGLVLTVPGDTWRLGDHVLHCGDSMENTRDKVAAGSVHMVFTDPPYGVDYNDKAKEIGSRHAAAIETYDAFVELPDDLEGSTRRIAEACSHALAPGGPIYVSWTTRPLNVACLINAFVGERFHLQSVLMWLKNRMILTHLDYHPKTELILYGWKAGKAHPWHGPENETQIWEFDSPMASPEHPTMKPVALVARAIRNSSKVGEVVFDPFMGSGTTIIACEQTDRKAIGFEIVPLFVDRTIRRWQTLTAEQAVHEPSGKTFDDLMQAKQAEQVDTQADESA